jgi:hypothetical protein
MSGKEIEIDVSMEVDTEAPPVPIDDPDATPEDIELAIDELLAELEAWIP